MTPLLSNKRTVKLINELTGCSNSLISLIKLKIATYSSYMKHSTNFLNTLLDSEMHILLLQHNY